MGSTYTDMGAEILFLDKTKEGRLKINGHCKEWRQSKLEDLVVIWATGCYSVFRAQGKNRGPFCIR